MPKAERIHTWAIKSIVPCSTVALFALAIMEPQTEGAET